MNDSMLVSVQLLLYAGLWLIASRVLGRERPAVWHWFGYCATSAVAVELVGQQKLHPELLITVAMDFSVLFGLVLARRGVELFMQVRPRDLQFVLLCTLALAGLFWVGPTAEAKPHRIAFVCALSAATVIGGIVSCRAAMLREFGRWATAAANVPAIGMSLMLLLTLAGALLNPAGIGHPSAKAELAQWLVTLVSAGVFNFLFVFLVAARLLRDLRHQARHDPLTGLLNRRAMTELLETEWARQQRTGSGFTLLAVDVDHFKRINDHHGHAAGDEVLREVAQVLRLLVRRIDRVGRMGGEEFLVLMPECDPVLEGHIAAERLRRTLADRAIGGPNGPTLQVTASWGVSGTRPGDHGPDDALRRADAALYAAKESGRNRVKLSA